MTGYAEQRTGRTGLTVWRNTSTAHKVDIVPDGVLDLMWHAERLVVAGPDAVSATVDTRPGAVTWGLRLPPGVAHAVLGVPVRELTGRRVELATLVTPPTIETTSDIPLLLERVLARLWTSAEPDPADLRLAAALDRAARRGRPVGEIIHRTGRSERSLRRTADRLFGYGLKTLAGIHRFQRALAVARSGTTLAEAAARAGYADQAHLNRDVRRLTGTTPGALLK